MPVLQYHLVEGAYAPEQLETLMRDSTRLFAEVLECPLDRIRVMIQLYRPELFAVGGVPISQGARPAPYFNFLVLEGRPQEHRQRLLTGFTGIIAGVLNEDPARVRGSVLPVAPENWVIGGVTADVLRREEIEARAAQQATR